MSQQILRTICKNNIYQMSDRSTGYKSYTKMHEYLNVGQWYELTIKDTGDNKWYVLSEGDGWFNDFGIGGQGADLYSFFMNTEELRDYQIDKINGKEDRI